MAAKDPLHPNWKFESSDVHLSENIEKQQVTN